METKTWRKFSAIRNKYREAVETLRQSLPKLRALQQELVNHRGGPAYIVETPVVYNSALDDVAPGDEIRLILVADNPGRREQAAENRRYLIGPSGKIAEKFFREHPELNINFRKNVIILNKTPIHTPRTADLRELRRLGDGPEPRQGGAKNSGRTVKIPAFSERLAESQEFMARLLLEFHRTFAPVPVWITGYSEMKPGGVFEPYTKTLGDLYRPESPNATPAARSAELFFFHHFSMNQFTIDLHRQAAPGETLAETLSRIGRAYRRRVLGW
ncbi:MAG: hypothetical protein LBK02_00815 [Treponema sp.]|nr:hypothetical protein [Treponema sp.]